MIGKILFLAAIFAIVYFGYRYYAQREQLKRANDAARMQRGGTPPGQAKADQTMSKCPVCASYVAPGAGSCGKQGCPY